MSIDRSLAMGVAASIMISSCVLLEIGCTGQLDTTDSVESAREQSDSKVLTQTSTTKQIDSGAQLDDSSTPVSSESAAPDGGLAGEVGALDGDVESPSPFIIVRSWDEKRFELTPNTSKGGFDQADFDQAREAWARYKTGQSTDIHPRLLDIIYKAARHFDAPYVIVSSGYRPRSKSSLHHWGRAADIHLPDVPCRKLAEHLRSYGFVGVGFYPRTNGVHIDIRQPSYFWVSWAPRGKRWRERGILFDLAKKMDRQALERGVEPPEPLPKSAQAAREAVSRRRRRATKKRRAAKRRRSTKRKQQPRQSSKAKKVQ